MIHPNTYIHPDARLAENVKVEPFTVIHEGVTIGEGTWISSNVTIMEGVTIGKNCRIFPGVQPKDVQAELQQLAGPKVTVTPDPNYIGEPTPPVRVTPRALRAYRQFRSTTRCRSRRAPTISSR